MGKHSSLNQGPFYGSLLVWLLPWVLVAGVVGVGVIVAVDALGRDELDAPPPAGMRSPTPRPTDTSLGDDNSEPRKTAVAPSPTPEPSATPEPKPTRVPLITEGVTVQVLNATSSPDAAAAMAERLEGLGFEIVAVQGASKGYEHTTVFWSYPDAKAAAEALASRFDWLVSKRPTNLSSNVAMHVIVGVDET